MTEEELTPYYEAYMAAGGLVNDLDDSGLEAVIRLAQLVAFNQRVPGWAASAPRFAAKLSDVEAQRIAAEHGEILVPAGALELLAWALPHVDSYISRELSDGAFGMKDDLDKLEQAKALLKAAGVAWE